MNSSAFEKVLLASILTSCAVFSVLMLAFIPRRSEPLTVEPPDLIASVEAINQRDVVIRHIGISIVVSVGAGITTAELIRKWGRSREAAAGLHVLGTQAMLQAVTVSNLAPSGDGFAASLPGFADTVTASDDRVSDNRWDLPGRTSVLEPDRDDAFEPAALPLSLFQPSMQAPDDDVNWFSPAQADSTSFAFDPAPGLPAADWQAPQLLASREQYQTCHIALPDASDRLFAILFEGQYYRFVRATVDREQALSIRERLTQRGEAAVVTQAEARYVVWALAEDVYLDNV